MVLKLKVYLKRDKVHYYFSPQDIQIKHSYLFTGCSTGCPLGAGKASLSLNSDHPMGHWHRRCGDPRERGLSLFNGFSSHDRHIQKVIVGRSSRKVI